MAVRPILFNTESVRAILDGKKTQTRRVIKGLQGLNVYRAEPAEDAYETLSQWDFFYGWSEHGALFDATESLKAPFAVGDTLWVRETWDSVPVSPERKWIFGGMYYYKADGDSRPSGWRGNWHPSIHMPRRAARIFLRVTDIHVEQLRDITEEQAMLEGFSSGFMVYSEDDVDEWTAVEDFSLQWDETIPKHPNKFKRHPWYWKDNPWVWVITFEKCEKPEGLWEDLYETD